MVWVIREITFRIAPEKSTWEFDLKIKDVDQSGRQQLVVEGE
jgi:hypothetical protein